MHRTNYILNTTVETRHKKRRQKTRRKSSKVGGFSPRLFRGFSSLSRSVFQSATILPLCRPLSFSFHSVLFLISFSVVLFIIIPASVNITQFPIDFLQFFSSSHLLFSYPYSSNILYNVVTRIYNTIQFCALFLFRRFFHFVSRIFCVTVKSCTHVQNGIILWS